MFQLLMLPFRLIGSLVSIVFRFVVGVLGVVFGAISGLFGLLGGLLGLLVGGAILILCAVGVIALIRLVISALRRA